MAQPLEKEFVEHVDKVEQKLAERSPSIASHNVDPKLIAKIRRRVDLRLIPALAAMYAILLMDRSNVSAAAIAGMLDDLNLSTGYGYSLINMTFFITYILLQPVMIIICRKAGPRWFLPLICALWGIVIIGFGFAKTWQTLIGLRLLLGILEAGYFPGCLYLLSCWYTKFEVARRYSIFYLVGSNASALSGILAYGLQQMHGIQGMSGWRWIFIMEGVITCIVAIFSVFFMVKFPDEERKKISWNFLKPDHLDIVIHRLNADRGDVEPEAFTWKKFLQPATDWYVYGFPLLLMLSTTIAYAFSFTLPIILRSKLKFDMAKSQCLVAPPYVFSAFLMYAAAWVGDKYKTRGPVLCVLSLISLIGLPIMGFVQNPWGQYVGVFITVSGTNSVIPQVMAYQANNIRGQWRRAFCSAALTGIGGIGGIAGALIFRTQDAPRYIPGFIACMVCNVLIMAIVAALSIYFRRCNLQADRGERILLEDPTFRFTI